MNRWIAIGVILVGGWALCSYFSIARQRILAQQSGIQVWGYGLGHDDSSTFWGQIVSHVDVLLLDEGCLRIEINGDRSWEGGPSYYPFVHRRKDGTVAASGECLAQRLSIDGGHYPVSFLDSPRDSRSFGVDGSVIAEVRDGTGLLVLADADGVWRVETRYRGGKIFGDIWRYADGQVLLKREMVNDREDGITVGYWPNGQPKRVTGYRNGKRDGVCSEYDEQGLLVTRATYRDGVGIPTAVPDAGGTDPADN